MCGHKQIGIWEISKITVVDSNDVVNHWMSRAVRTYKSVAMYSCISEHSELTSQ